MVINCSINRNIISLIFRIVLTAYSPATVALHDLVKSQVELTKRLINQSRTLSDHVTGSATPTYQYVTLDQTKEVNIIAANIVNV